MAVESRYASGVNRFCEREFGVPAGDACRERLSDAYKTPWGK